VRATRKKFAMVGGAVTAVLLFALLPDETEIEPVIAF